MALEGKTEEWLKQHLGCSSGSSVSEQIGWSIYGTPIQSWDAVRKAKHKEFSEENQKYLDYGNENEPNNMKTFAILWGVDLYESPFVYDKTHKRLRTTPDGYIRDDIIDNKPAVLECKCPQKLYEHPPPNYLPQMYCEMNAYGTYKCYFTAWSKSKMIIWMVLWDDKMWNFIKLFLYRFWECLKADIAPVESIIPIISNDMQRWCEKGYSEKFKQIWLKYMRRTKPLFVLPPTPLICKVYEATGEFLPDENKFKVEDVILSKKLTLKGICNGSIKPKTEFEKELYRFSKLDVKKVDLRLYCKKDGIACKK